MGKKAKLLLLCHRVPFPPNKGDKIRAFHVVKFLSQYFDIYLGCLVDNPDDGNAYKGLQPFCRSVVALPVKKRHQYLRAIGYLLLNKPLSLAFFANRSLAKWVKNVVKLEQIDQVLLMSSSMFQYIEANAFGTTLIDMIDVDSCKWEQYATRSSGYKEYIYRREHRLLGQYEKHLVARADKTFLVSEHEATLLTSRLPEAQAELVSYFNNGVNCEYFDPKSQFAKSEPASIDLVFVGNMDYLSNVISVQWFCHQVWPLVSKRNPHATFYIVGSNPSNRVLALSRISGVTVTGSVADVRPYLFAAKLVVAPLLIGQGIQNKVLEAMAMAKPVVCTNQAATGIDTQGLSVYVTQQPQLMAEYITQLLQCSFSALDNRRWAVNNLQWHQCLKPLLAALKKETT